ncbi:DUF3301 domain-containing protein [Marinobacter halodurans]|uniref:DUF3301 domain-containing protein n=1 Tax=Marinobacter halodurans TaxID=2528979 RepID=A0ABY1ZPV5_9GAMM|nr:MULTISPECIES: DUF3301 domain-containing protein [Marinobacter]ROT95743.1 DUF3301 domain-containing protein [Marinobacter sp. R17]TBW58891.1 DUF3301 domain-containing protein [Marinobacter halodurans]
MELGELFWLFLFGFVAWYWWRAKAIKDQVLLAARQYCKTMDVALLDDAVYLRGLWFKRDPEGRIRVWRRFLFEFTATGEERYTGRAILLGSRIEHMQLDPHRMPPGDLH